MSPIHPENLERDIESIKQRRNGAMICMANEQPYVKKIPLDSPGLMRITGGGIPIGRVTRLWGAPAAGKSLTALEIIKCGQKIKDGQFPLGMFSVYWDIEGAFDKEFAEYLGVDMKMVVHQDADIIEDVGLEMKTLLGSAHLHVIDSCSDGKPLERLSKEVYDSLISASIRAWEKSFEYITHYMDKTENALVLVDHESKPFQGKGAAKAVGGKEMEHLSALSIHLKRGAYLYYDDEEMLQTEDKFKEKGILGIAGSKEADGVEILAKVNKSRVCMSGRSAIMRLDLNTLKFDRTFELMDAAMYYDKEGRVAHLSKQPALAHKAASWFTLPNGDKIQGEKALRKRIDDDFEYRNQILKSMLAGKGKGKHE